MGTSLKRAYTHTSNREKVWDAMRSRVGPIKKSPRNLRLHQFFILNWFRVRVTISSGVVKGFKGREKLSSSKPFDLWTPEDAETALFHVLQTMTRAWAHPQVLLRREKVNGGWEPVTVRPRQKLTLLNKL